MRLLLLLLLLMPGRVFSSGAWEQLPTADQELWSEVVSTIFDQTADPAELFSIYSRIAPQGASDDSSTETLLQRRWLELELARTLATADHARAIPEPTDAQLREYYDQRKRNYERPESLNLFSIQIRVSNESEEAESMALAEEADRLLRAGVPFNSVALRFSDSNSRAQGGTVGTLPKGRLAPTVDELVWSLADGETTGPIRLDRGYYFFRVTNKTPATSFEDAATLDRVRRDWHAGELAIWADSISKGWQAKHGAAQDLAPGDAEMAMLAWITWGDSRSEPRGLVWWRAGMNDLGIYLGGEPIFEFSEEAPFHFGPICEGLAALEGGVGETPEYRRALELGLMAAQADRELRRWFHSLSPTEEELGRILEEGRSGKYADTPLYSPWILSWPIPVSEMPSEGSEYGLLMMERIRTMSAVVSEHRQRDFQEARLAIQRALPGSEDRFFERVESLGPYIDPSLVRTPKGQYSRPAEESGTLHLVYMVDRENRPATVSQWAPSLKMDYRRRALAARINTIRQELGLPVR